MTAKRSICVYNCSVWGSSNLSYLEKYITGGGHGHRVHIFKNTSIALCCISAFLHLILGKKFLFCKVQPVLIHPLFATMPIEPYWQHLLLTNIEIITERAYRDGWKERRWQTECWFPPLSASCLWDGAICTFIITAMIPLLFCVATRTCSVWPLLFLSAV